MAQRPGDSKLSPSSKFSSQESQEASDGDNALPLTTSLNQVKDSPLFTCPAESSIPQEKDLAENDWAGYGYDHNDLPKIVAVHTKRWPGKYSSKSVGWGQKGVVKGKERVESFVGGFIIKKYRWMLYGRKSNFFP